tara:strand:+ start:11250 stop:11735 length:486 start_codon:yes stop_codon:yes gene_type:complete
MEVRMKRFWMWLGNLFSFLPGKYRFLRQETCTYKEGRVVVFVSQRVYRRWRRCRREYWYGAVRVELRMVGVRLVYRSIDHDDEILGKVLAAKEEYTLRRDADYVYLLRHLLFMREACNLTESEGTFVKTLKSVIMLLWPPRSSLDIRVCDDAFENLSNGLS